MENWGKSIIGWKVLWAMYGGHGAGAKVRLNYEIKINKIGVGDVPLFQPYFEFM